METWRLIHSWNAEPGFNMALDEALLLQPGAPPCLRFYTWNPATLSLGYFQKTCDVPNLERAQAVVRRLTGGGAIHHAAELTFSISCDQTHALYAGEVRSSYQLIHAAIAEVLAEYAVRADFRGQAKLLSERASGGMCFEHSSDLDLAWDGSKGVGSAQRRSGGRVLHHGSIKLGRSLLDASVATIWDHTPGLTAEALAEGLARHFEDRFRLRLVRAEPEPSELERARQRSSHFTSREFVYRR